MANANFVALKDLEVLQLSQHSLDLVWGLYINFSFEHKKLLGNQFVRTTNSVGANIVEGYGRYHFLDKIKIFYNARASLYEAFEQWSELMVRRKVINEEGFKPLRDLYKKLQIKLNNFITITYNQYKKGK